VEKEKEEEEEKEKEAKTIYISAFRNREDSSSRFLFT
jgi:hypothetical protein